MNDLKFTTAADYMKDQETANQPPESCYIIEGEWAKDTEEKNERTMGRKVQTENR